MHLHIEARFCDGQLQIISGVLRLKAALSVYGKLEISIPGHGEFLLSADRGIIQATDGTTVFDVVLNAT